MVDFNKTLNEIESQWSTKKGLLIVLGIASTFLVWIFTSAELRKISPAQWVVLIVALLLVVVLWWLTRLPRVPKGKVGFGVAILYEDGGETQKIRADFVVRLRQLVLDSERLRYLFHFIEFTPRLARRFVESEHERLSAQTGCHFIIYGQAKSRNLGGAPSYVVELNGIVRHGEFSDEFQRQFGEDFGQLLPSRMVVKDPNSLLAFEFAARHVDIVARYVIGVAAAFTGDAAYGEQLLLDAKGRLDQLPIAGDVAAIAVVRSRISTRLADLYDSLLGWSQSNYLRTRADADLRESETIVAKRRLVSNDDYRVCQSAAMCAFLLHGDIDQAREEYSKCHSVDDASWRYGEAFLSTYVGDLDRAYREYRSAFAAPLSDDSVPNQCEEFIQIVLEREPDRYWLHFALGMINYRAKGDLIAAQRDFQRFVDCVETGRFLTQITAVRQWLREIERKTVCPPVTRRNAEQSLVRSRWYRP